MEPAEVLVRAALDDLNRHDVEGFFTRCTKDYTTTNELGVFSGKDENRALYAAFEGIPDHWRTIERVEVAGSTVSVWLKFGGTVASTGRTFEQQGCTVWEVRGDLLSSAIEHASYQPAIDASQPET